MKVVRHERVAVDDNLPEVGVVVQEDEEVSAVVVAEEHLLSIIATLCNVQRIVRRGESEFTGHLINKVDFTGNSSHLFCETNAGAPAKGYPFEIAE